MARRAVCSRKRCSGIRVDRIVGRLPGRQMASRIAAVIRSNRQRVVVVDVAIRTSRNFSGRGQLMRIRQWEAGHGVIEGRRSPRNRVVTGGAVRHAESRACRGMHGVIRLLPGRQVASRVSAVRCRDIQAVIVIDMAGSARRYLAAIGHERVRIR